MNQASQDLFALVNLNSKKKDRHLYLYRLAHTLQYQGRDILYIYKYTI